MQLMITITSFYYRINILCQSRSHLVLEAFEDELPLLVLILSNSVFRLQLVILHEFGVFQIHLLRVEPVRAHVQHRPFVDFRCFVLGRVYLRIVLHEVTDPLYEFATFLLRLEILFLRQVGQANEDMHEHRYLDLLPHELQHHFH